MGGKDLKALGVARKDAHQTTIAESRARASFAARAWVGRAARWANMGYEEAPWIFTGRCVEMRACVAASNPAKVRGRPIDCVTRSPHGIIHTGRCTNCTWSRRQRCVLAVASRLAEAATLRVAYAGTPKNSSNNTTQHNKSMARKYIPDQFKLVELFGYTLGGFYLARYEDSPVGAFDEVRRERRRSGGARSCVRHAHPLSHSRAFKPPQPTNNNSSSRSPASCGTRRRRARGRRVCT